MAAAKSAAKIVLVVDDNVDLVNLLRRTLQRMGFQTTGANSAEAALAELDRQSPHLALLDGNLPDNGSAAVFGALAGRSRPVPYIVLGAHGQESGVADMLRHGAIDYLMKDAALLDLLPEVVNRAFATVEARQKLQHAEFSLAQLRRNYELLLNAVGEGLCGLDLEGKITFVNAAGLRMLGYESNDLLGQDLGVLADRPSSGDRDMKQNVAANSTFRCQDQFFWRKDGTCFPIEYTSTPVREGGRQIGSVFVFRDLSKRRELEDQVRQWQKLEAVGRLASGIAHDFNNLLTVISGYVDLLHNNSSLDDRGRSMVGLVRDATSRAVGLTRQLLAFGQKQALRPRPIQLDRFLRDLKPLLVRALGQDVMLDLDVSPDVPQFQVDPGQLEQVFVNLAVNAREALPDGGRITIAAGSLSMRERHLDKPHNLPPGDYVSITVSDTGTGVADDLLREVFDPFPPGKDNRRGVGLGLATVYGIIMQSGGHIEAVAAPDGGTMFRLLFPALPAASATLHMIDHSAAAGDETILLIEADNAVRSLTAEVLQGLGYRVLEASDAHEGERLFRAAIKDVEMVVADVAHTGGWQLVDRMRARKPDLPAIVATTGADEFSANGHSCVSVLPKPYTPEQLAMAVRELFDQVTSAIR